MADVLSVRNLSVNFDERRVLHNLSFDLPKGETLAIIGPNGSGKTVLLRALLNIISFEGEIVWSPETRLGYVPQKIEVDHHLPLNVANLLTAKADVMGIPRSRIKATTERMQIPKRLLETPVGHLSGGQFQKAFIAFALLGDPNVILFDEPTANLDQLSEEHIYELMQELQKERGMTIILVSHELSVVYRYSTKVLCLNKEKICFGPPEEALDPEILKKLYGPEHKLHHHHD